MAFTEQQYRDYLAREAARKGGRSATCPTCGVEVESEMHDQIIAECKRLGWLWIHARMDKASHMTVGAPDFIILAEGGRVLLVECKTRTGKIRPEQAAFAAWAGKLGHAVHVMRSMEEFHAVKKFGDRCSTPEGK